MVLQQSKRRSTATFYPLELPLRYKLENQTTGRGFTTELNGEIVRFKCDRSLPVGENIQLILTWPISLSDGTPLNLWVTGSVLDALPCEIVVSVTRHEFRTRRTVQSRQVNHLEPAVVA